MVATIDLDRTALAVHVVRSRPIGQRVIGTLLIAALWHPIKDAVDPEHLFSTTTISGIGVIYLAGLVLVEDAAAGEILDFAYPIRCLPEIVLGASGSHVLQPEGDIEVIIEFAAERRDP